MRFDELSDGDFFRKPGTGGIFRKVPPQYESIAEINVLSSKGTVHFVNGNESVIKVTESTPRPTEEELALER